VRDRVDGLAGVLAATGFTVFVTLLAGVHKIGRSFNYDEGFTYAFFINGGSPRQALTTQIVFNNHPMFSFTQTLGWRVGLVGETAQRLGPVLCGAATVGLLTWFVARRGGVLAGLASGLFLLLNPIFMNEFRNLRGYSLATLCVFVAALAIERSWHDPRRRWMWLQAVVMVVAVTTHSYSALTLLVLAAAALVLGRVGRRHIITWVLAAAAALAIAAPVLDDARRNAESRGNAYLPWFGEFTARSLFGYEWLPVTVVGVLTAVGVVSLAQRSTRHAAATGVAITIFAGTILILWQVIQPRDLYPRFFISVLPFLAATAGVGVRAVLDTVTETDTETETDRPSGRARPLVGIMTIAAISLAVAGLAPRTQEILAIEPTIRDGAAFADRARTEGLSLCGRNAEPMSVYTETIRPIGGLDDFGDCDVYMAVLGLDAARRDAALERFGSVTELGGGVRVFASFDVLERLAPPP
jgi:4-amino-4-deoxy-L-arabinose transferase-like glycosyltransferase